MNYETTSKSANIELVSIYFVVFGIPIIISVSTAFFGGPRTFTFTNNSLGYMVGIEVITGLVAWLILHTKGWNLSDFNINITPKQTLLGFAVAAIDLGLFYLIEFFLKATQFQSAQLVTANISTATALTVSIVNPFFEEFFVVGYTVERAENQHGKFFTIAISAFVRFLYHLYQGPIAVWILILGIFHAYIHIKWRKLWPLVVAHAVLNFAYFGIQ